MNHFTQCGIAPYGATPSEIQLNHLILAKKAMICFGVNTFTDVEWGNGSETEKIFNPIGIDVKSWIQTLKDAGFKAAILTVKHHDGFCLWQSAYTEHCMKNSPYQNGKGDIVREFTDACHELGVLAGVYISPWDRNSPFWNTPEYSDYYKNQLTELMTGYGKIDEVWWDGAGSTEAVYRWDEWADVIRKYQPTAGIFGSMGATPYVSFRWVGNERGFAGEMHYASIDPKYVEDETTPMMNVGVRSASRYLPAEVDVSIRPGWYYHADQDDKVKTVAEIDKIWFESVGRNAMMLLSFAPNKQGQICPTDRENAIESHRRISKMLSVNFAEDAKITADSERGAEFAVGNLLNPDREKFYAPEDGRTKAVIDIFPASDADFNIILIRETVELGERITFFKVEEMTDSGAETVAEGTSVGFCKAVILPRKKYGHLRLTFRASDTFPILTEISLHDYPYSNVYAEKTTPENVLVLKSARTELSDDHKTAVFAFGGIYNVNHISVCTEKGANAVIDVFDGTNYHEAAKVTADENGRITASFPTESCYQIRIVSDKEIRTENAVITKK